MASYKKSMLGDGSSEILGTQLFEYETCRPSTDVTFQFGYLEQAQRQFIGDPTKFVAVTIRTNYDPINLRGKGFVYVSPDSGSDRYLGVELVNNAWSLGNGGLLYFTLLHEFGHIFGLPHIPGYAPGQSGRNGLMSETFTENILNKRVYDAYQFKDSNAPIMIFDYKSSKKISRCLPQMEGHRWRVFDVFNANQENGRCLYFDLADDGIEVYQFRHSPSGRGDHPISPMRYLGKIFTTKHLDFEGGKVPSSNHIAGYLPFRNYFLKF